MSRTLVIAAAVLVGAASMSAADEPKKAPAALNFKMKDIDGKEVDLAKFAGKVVLFVNVASECGLTPQYKGLQELHDKYAAKGLVIIGVPANEFGKQEPGADVDIKKFCESKYDVKFLMLSKVVVKGEGIAPLYEHLTTKTEKKFQGPVAWNFAKFVIGRDGEVAARFAPRVEPKAKELIASIEAELAKK